jgi:hypothetical protein
MKEPLKTESGKHAESYPTMYENPSALRVLHEEVLLLALAAHLWLKIYPS